MKRLTYLVVGVIITVLLMAPGVKSAEITQATIDGAKKEGKVIWWGTDSPKMAEEIVAAFNKKYPFVKVEYTKGVGTDFGDRILMEADANICTADFVNGADSVLDQMIKRDLLKNVSDMPFMKLWPKGTKDPKGTWFGMNATYWVLAYNSKLISASEAPKSYDEIVDPKWKGQFAIEERPDQWFLGLWLAWGQEKATKILEKVVANKPFIGKGYDAMTELLVAGQYKFIFPLQDYKIVQFQGKKAPINWVPMRPTEVTFQGAHIMKNAPHPHAVDLFLRWLTSKEGQGVYSKVTSKASLHPDLAAQAPLQFPKKNEMVYRTPESYGLLGDDGAVIKTYNRLVHGM